MHGACIAAGAVTMHPCLQASQSVESVGGSFQNFDCSKVTNIITQKSPSSHKRDLVDTKGVLLL